MTGDSLVHVVPLWCRIMTAQAIENEGNIIREAVISDLGTNVMLLWSDGGVTAYSTIST